MAENQLIVVKQLPVIEEQLKAVRQQVVERTQAALNAICTADNYKDIKKVRADLNKEFSQFEDQRKEVKAAILTPYNEFEATYLHCIGEPYKRADAALKEKIGQVEDVLKSEKEEETRKYFTELCAASGVDFLSWEQTGIKATMSASVNQMKTAANNFVDKVTSDISAIAAMPDKDEIMVEFKQCLDLSRSVQTVDSRHKALEAQREAEARRKEAEEARKAHEAEVAAAAEARRKAEGLLNPPKVEQPEPKPEPVKIYTAKFIARGTLGQLKALKEYMQVEGIGYESIK